MIKVFYNILYYSLGNYFPLLASFLLLPIYTKYLSPEDYGEIAFIQVIVAIINIFLTLQLQSSVSRYFVDFLNDKAKLQKYISTIFYSIVFISFFITLTVILIFLFFEKYYFMDFDSQFNNLLLLALLTANFVAYTSISKAVLKFEEKGKLFFFCEVFCSFLSIVSYFYFVVILNYGVTGVIYSGLIISIISFIIFFIFTKYYFVLKYNFEYLLPSLRFSWPLIPHALSSFLFISSDRILLEKYVPMASLGIYAIASRLSSPVGVLIENMNSAYNPYLFKAFNNNLNKGHLEFRKLSNLLLFFTLVIITFFFTFARELVWILTQPSFHEAYFPAMVLSLCYIFRLYYGFFGSSIIFIKKTKIFPIITILCGLSNIVLNLIFIPKYGIIAAAYTTLFSYFLQCFISYFISRAYFPLSFSRPRNAVSLSLFIFTIIIQVLINYQFKDLLLSIMSKSLIILIFFFLCYYILNINSHLIRFKEKL